MKKYFSIILFLVLTVICLSGCIYGLVIPAGDQTDDLGTGKGTLKIYLTDAPGDYLEVNIIISKIEGHIAGDGEEEEDKGSWEVLKEWSGGLQVDLTELIDRSILLASLELEPNKYTQLRLFLMGGEEDAWVVLEESEGSEEPTSIEFLEIPSSANTGIKLNRPFEIIEDWITKLTIDFDAEKSVVKTGNGKYKLKPVIHVSSETYSEGEEPPEGSGSVFGTVSYDGGDLGLIGIGEASVSLSGGEYIFVYNTATSEDGSFSLDNVPAGSYTLNVYTDDYGDYSEIIVVENGVDIEVNVVFLLEEPGAISGSVVDSEGGSIEGATVSVTLSGSAYIFNSSAVTDEDGFFLIDQLPVGTYTLNVSADGYTEYTTIEYELVYIEGGLVYIEVIEGETTNVDIELTP